MPKWIPTGYPYSEEWDRDRSGITKKRGLQHAYEKVRKEAQFRVLKSLILTLWPTRNHCFHFCWFAQSVLSFVARSLQNWVIWRPAGAQRWNQRGLRKHVKNMTRKVPTFVTILVQKEGLKKCFFHIFLNASPRWPPRRPRTWPKASPDRPQGPKTL